MNKPGFLSTFFSRQLVATVPAFSVAVLRIAFGLLLAGWAFDYLRMDRVRLLCAPDVFHFTWWGFSWVRPWPGDGMVLQFIVMLIAAMLIAAGAFYRVAAILFALGFTHFFLIDRTNYQNHYYLVLLLSWVMVLIPANRLWSLDVLSGRTERRETIPGWCLFLLRFHIALPYVFGGIAKFDSDWLSGDPARHMLLSQPWIDSVSRWISVASAASILTWGGLLFDLLIVPAVLWRRTRRMALVLCTGFHLCNAFLFHIHIFPWLMMIATTIFCSPEWPRRWLSRLTAESPHLQNESALPSSVTPQISRTGTVVLLSYCLFQLSWPLRHHLDQDNTSWTERGHYFSWRMMLRGKTVGLRYYLTDPVTGETREADIRGFLNHEQQIKFMKDPEMILDLAHALSAARQRQTQRPVEVRALVLASLNGRKPQLLIDPTVNLAAEPRGWQRRPWVLPLTEPRREQPWTLPVEEWEAHVNVPHLPVVTSSR